MTSVHSSSLDVDEVDLSGLVESVVDSDEEDLAESMDVSYSKPYTCVECTKESFKSVVNHVGKMLQLFSWIKH